MNESVSAFDDLAQIVHDDHRLSSGVDSWRNCQQLICHRARRIARKELPQVKVVIEIIVTNHAKTQIPTQPRGLDARA